MRSAEYPVVIVNFVARTKKFTGRLCKSFDIFAAFRMTGFFKKLRSSLDKTEKYLSNMNSELEQQRRFSKYRKLSFAGIAYILTAVWLKFIVSYTSYTKVQ